MKVRRTVFADDGAFPNSVLPLIAYLGVVKDASAEAFEHIFNANGWPPQWRGSIYTYHHYHSIAHEVLGVSAGSAEVAFGGPEGEVMSLEAGDAVTIPAGVAHKLVSASEDFAVVGAYPPGADWDVLKGEPGERPDADHRIAKVRMPDTDPLEGGSGPVLTYWRS